MISLFTRRENCSGCGACAAVCPSFAIRMEPDGEGFRYPAVDGARCSECGQCAAICPMAREREKGLDGGTAAYAFQHSRPEVLRRSASGGAFTALAEAFLARGGKAHVYGAVLRGGKVFHRFVDDPAELPVFSDSKYVESDPGDSAISIRRQLERGEDVLFSGTPCQADGIKAGLTGLPQGAVRDHLLLVEVICNGVGSPLVWQKCWEQLMKDEPSPVTEYTFRDKSRPGGYGVSWRREDGSVKREFLLDNFYWRMYDGGLILRPSCHHCHYAGYRRAADITIGDFHGFEETPGRHLIDAAKGVSLVLCNTDRGREFAACLQDAGTVTACPTESAMQPRLRSAAPQHPLRKLAMQDISDLPYEVFRQKYCRLAGMRES